MIYHLPHMLAAANPVNIEWLPFATIIIVFLVTLWILAKYVWPVITNSLDERNRKIADEIRSAEEAREQAKKTLADYERNLAQAREEAQQMVTRAKQDAKALAEELRAKNEQELTAMKDRATREIESAKQTAISELHQEAAALAANIAGKILEREISAEDQQKFVEESMRELETVSRN